MTTHILMPWFKTFDSKQIAQKAQKDEKLVIKKNFQPTSARIKQNNDLKRIVCKVWFCSSFNKSLLNAVKNCVTCNTW